MEAKELRIGNYALYIHRGKKQISQIDGSDIIALSDNPLFKLPLGLIIEPIPLTEDWLIKFGFEFDDISYRQELGSYNIIKTKRGFDFGFEYQDYNTPIDYVHQLQNLYFALTGEEL